jgi:hypothetical protein
MHHEEYLIVNEFGFSKMVRLINLELFQRIESIN